MAMQVYISHSGARVFAPPQSLQSIDSLRLWIADVASIPPTRQILMTRRGKNVKQQHLLSEDEVFVYDKQFLSPGDETPTKAARTAYTFPKQTEPPKLVSDESSLSAYQELFMGQRTWALSAAEDVRIGVDHVREYTDEADVIVRSTSVALDNLRTHVGTLQAKFETTQKWAQDMLQEHKAVLDDWQGSANVLKELSIRQDLASLLNGGEHMTPNKSESTLFNLIRTDDIEDAAVRLAEASGRLRGRLKDLVEAMHDLDDENTTAQNHSAGDLPEPVDLDGLLEESETLAKRVGADYEEILRLQDNSKSLAFASRRSTVHMQELLPTLQNILSETSEALKSSASVRNELSRNFIFALKEISVIESGLGALQAQVVELDNESRGGNDLDMINQVFHLPIAYGSILIEAVRRSEWNAQMETELNLLRDGVVPIQDEEEKRRKRWFKTMGQFLQEALGSRDTDIDIQFTMSRDEWPEASRDEVYTYIDDLKALGIDDAVQEMTDWLKELESPPKRRKQIPKTFKNGSVYDLDQSSIFRANGGDFKTLQDDKSRLEEKLRAADSRVRKLEDLLHRQSQMVGPANGSFGPTTPDTHSPSPTPLQTSKPYELLSRRSSVSSRRLSNQTPDEKAPVQRIVSLEAEVARLQREAHAERRASTESRDKMQEAESVKHDLMANFEAQRQEFDDERQLLDDEVHRLKIRLDEAEDELDRLVGSRDHQRVTSEQTITNLQAELEQLRRASTTELSKARKDSKTASEEIKNQVTALARRIEEMTEEQSTVEEQKSTLMHQVREHKQTLQEQISALKVAHSNLSPDRSAPDDPQRLASAISVLSEGLAIHSRGTEEALAKAELDNTALQDKTEKLEWRIAKLEEDLKHREEECSAARLNIQRETVKAKVLQAELDNQTAQVGDLRAKLTSGENGSEELRVRLSEAEQKVVELTERVAIANASRQTLQLEHAIVKDQLDKQNAEMNELISRLETRGARATELSHRLLQYNEKIIRMLEALGYSISRQGDTPTLLIQRASKVNASLLLPNASTIESSTQMKRTASGSSPPYQPDTSELEHANWPSSSSPSTENTQYSAFLFFISRLELTPTLDIVTKRHLSLESAAKKYQRDSRASRSQLQRLQLEAADKIAYRNFKAGDLALFLPTRNQATRPWAAFNVGAPHYFLREREAHGLQRREWLLARIGKVEERVVDLSRSMTSTGQLRPDDRRSLNTEASDAASLDDDNPFELSDGLRWYLIDAIEESRTGAPSTPPTGSGLGKSKSTVAASNVEVSGSFGLSKEAAKKHRSSGSTSGAGGEAVTKTLTRSLDSRRSSSVSASRRPAGLMASPSTPAKEGMLPVAKSGAQAAGAGPGEAGHATDDAGPGDTEAEAEAAAGASASPNVVIVAPAPSDNQPGQQAREDARLFDVGGRLSPAKTGGVATGSPIRKPGKKGFERLWGVEYNSKSSSSKRVG